ncbi:MAG: EamA family transporter, partial [Hyphomicrobiales bacterium]
HRIGLGPASAHDGHAGGYELDLRPFSEIMRIAGCESVDAVLKVDIEGSEAEVFSRHTDGWIDRVDNLVVELHGDRCREVVLAAILYAKKGAPAFRAMRPVIGRGIAGGAMQLVGYTVIIWAFSQAPVAMVAALRESSVLFAALLAVVLLKEPFGPIRAVATVLVCLGAILIKIG